MLRDGTQCGLTKSKSTTPYPLITVGMNGTTGVLSRAVSYCDHLLRAVGAIVELDSDQTLCARKKERNAPCSK